MATKELIKLDVMKGDRIYKSALSEAQKDNADLNYVFGLLEKARKQNNPKATYALGTWYLHGKFVKRDIDKAFALIKEAADENITDACFDLAVCYENGTGTPKDLPNAFKSYLQAALLGDKKSIYEVGRCYYYGLGVKKDLGIAEIWLAAADLYGFGSD